MDLAALNAEDIEAYWTFKGKLIQYDSVKRALEQITALHQLGDALCMLVVGPSRAGKSATLELYAKQHSSVSEPDRDRLPVLSVEVPPGPTLKGFVQDTLMALGAPSATGSTQVMTQKIRELIRLRGVEIIFIDEVNNLVDQSTLSHKVAYSLADWIKSLLNAKLCPIVLSGTEIAEKVIKENKQLDGRCMFVSRFSAFGYADAEEQARFKYLLKQFEELLPLPEVSRLASHEMATRIHVATFGLVGLVSLLLRTAWILAKQRGIRSFTMPLLAEAWTKGGKDFKGENPFLSTNDQKPQKKIPDNRTTRLHGKRRPEADI